MNIVLKTWIFILVSRKWLVHFYTMNAEKNIQIIRNKYFKTRKKTTISHYRSDKGLKDTCHRFKENVVLISCVSLFKVGSNQFTISVWFWQFPCLFLNQNSSSHNNERKTTIQDNQFLQRRLWKFIKCTFVNWTCYSITVKSLEFKDKKFTLSLNPAVTFEATSPILETSTLSISIGVASRLFLRSIAFSAALIIKFLFYDI